MGFAIEWFVTTGFIRKKLPDKYFDTERSFEGGQPSTIGPWYDDGLS